MTLETNYLESNCQSFSGSMKGASYKSGKPSNYFAKQHLRMQSELNASALAKIEMSLTSANVVMSGIGTGINVYQDHNTYTKAGLTGADYDAAMASSVIVETGGTALTTLAVIGATGFAVGCDAPIAAVVAVGAGSAFIASAVYDYIVGATVIKGRLAQTIRDNSSIENPYLSRRDY